MPLKAKRSSETALGRRPPEDSRMRITWYGHAAFLVEAAGLRIILDPYRYPDAGGYLPIDEHGQIPRRVYAQLAADQIPIAFVGAARLTPVGLRGMRLDKRALGAFTKRIGADRRQCRVDGIGIAAGVHQPPAQRLQGVQHPLPDALTLHDRPVLIESR